MSADFDDFQLIRAVGCVDEHFLSHLVLEERRAHGGLVGNFVFHRVRLGGARQLVRFVLLQLRVIDLYRGANVYE